MAAETEPLIAGFSISYSPLGDVVRARIRTRSIKGTLAVGIGATNEAARVDAFIALREFHAAVGAVIADG